jgi:hypothetical protein
MLRAEDVAEAVESGLISEAQARGLEALAAARRKARVFAVGREERFKLLGGFNDFFIALGVLLLGIGFQFFPLVGGRAGRTVATGSETFAMWDFAAVSMVGLLIFWGLAEYLTGRLKLVAPSIVIVAFLAVFASSAAMALTPPFLRGGATLGPAFAVGIVGLHYARFRLPFALFVLALAGVLLAIGTSVAAFHAVGISDADTRPLLKWVALVLGLLVFAWAMTFDVGDPERLTRRADCGFWLHLLAAPLIVHPLAGPLINHPLFPDYSKLGQAVTGGTVLVVLALVVALSIVALVVDRRALLVAGLGYLGSALAYTISQVSGASMGAVVLPTLAFIGILIIVLGVGWREIRAVVMAAVPGRDWKRSLPPYERSS